MVRQHWVSHCVRLLKLREAFSYVEKTTKLTTPKTKDSLMQVDEGGSPQQSLEEMLLSAFKTNFTSAKGTKLLHSLMDDTLYLI